MMPRMDGLELLQKIRTVHRLKSMRVIICTTVQERSKFIQATSLDIAYYLGKHPDQSMTISRMPKPDATQAVKTIESTLIARGA